MERENIEIIVMKLMTVLWSEQEASLRPWIFLLNSSKTIRN